MVFCGLFIPIMSSVCCFPIVCYCLNNYFVRFVAGAAYSVIFYDVLTPYCFEFNQCTMDNFILLCIYRKCIPWCRRVCRHCGGFRVISVYFPALFRVFGRDQHVGISGVLFAVHCNISVRLGIRTNRSHGAHQSAHTKQVSENWTERNAVRCCTDLNYIFSYNLFLNWLLSWQQSTEILKAVN